MKAAHPWRQGDLVDFTDAAAPSGFTPAVRADAGGVHVARGRLAANDGARLGAAQLTLAIVESGAFDFEWRPGDGADLNSTPLLPNAALIVPPDNPCTCRWDARPTILTVAFDRDFIDKRRAETGLRGHHEIAFRCGLRDPEIDSIIAKLRLELQFGGWSGRRYLESLGVLLAVHLLRNYAGVKSVRTRGAGLGGRRLREIAEYIEAHLGEEVTLDDLARLAGLSAHHFASAFRVSAGVAPHRYLLERRMARGCELLAKSEASVTAIAHGLGFSSHGHFSESFRRFVGVTPSDYRTRSR